MFFTLKVQVDWDIDREKRTVVFARLRKVFAKFRRAFPQSRKPRDGAGWVDLEGEDEALISAVMAWMDKTGENYEIVLNDCWTIQELVRARWLLPRFAYQDIDHEKLWRPLNRFPVIRCKACGLHDETVVDEPYKVNERMLLGGLEIFEGTSRLIVNRRVLELFKELVRSEIDSGKVAIVSLTGKVPKITPRFYWVKPKHTIGRDTQEVLGRTCRRCRIRLADCRGQDGSPVAGKRKGRLFRNRPIVQHFGENDWNLAWAGTVYGGIDGGQGPDGVWHINRTIVFSGGLWAHLYNCRVKGIMPEQVEVDTGGGAQPRHS